MQRIFLNHQLYKLPQARIFTTKQLESHPGLTELRLVETDLRRPSVVESLGLKSAGYKL